VNIPVAPGLPPLIRATDFVALTVELLVADVLGLFYGFTREQWGIYQGGGLVVAADTVTAFSYKQSWSVSDFPLERGAFESYDKVQVPFDARFTFVAGGSSARRQALLDSLAAIAGNLELYTVVTPDAVYGPVTITNYDYDRAANHGLGLLSVDVWTLEVRETATQQNTTESGSPVMGSTSSPNNAAQTMTGTVQSTPATNAQVGAMFGGGLA